MLNFWATWCAPCRVEMPELEKVYRRRHAQGLEILAVSQDEDWGAVEAYLEKAPVSFPVLVDDRLELGARFGVSAVPTTLFLDREGRVLEIIEGVDFDLESRVDRLLGGF